MFDLDKQTDFLCLLESSGKSWKFFLNFAGHGKCWKMSFDLENPEN